MPKAPLQPKPQRERPGEAWTGLSHAERAHRQCAAAPLSAVAKGAVCPSQQSQMGGFTEAQMK
jgi:hypothetical protein